MAGFATDINYKNKLLRCLYSHMYTHSNVCQTQAGVIMIKLSIYVRYNKALTMQKSQEAL